MTRSSRRNSSARSGRPRGSTRCSSASWRPHSTLRTTRSVTSSSRSLARNDFGLWSRSTVRTADLQPRESSNLLAPWVPKSRPENHSPKKPLTALVFRNEPNTRGRHAPRVATRPTRPVERPPAQAGYPEMTSQVLEERFCSRLIIVNRAGELLLFQYKDEHQSPFWATVGGELQPGESHLDAACRELLEETGQKLPIGPMVRSRDAIYPVARSVPAQWRERYFLVRTPDRLVPSSASWTEEERSTIQAWKWWRLDEMQRSSEKFIPEWLAELAESLEDGRRGADPDGSPHELTSA